MLCGKARLGIMLFGEVLSGCAGFGGAEFCLAWHGRVLYGEVLLGAVVFGGALYTVVRC